MTKPAYLDHLLKGTALLGACALSLVVPRIAEACSPGEPLFHASLPADGGTYPGNAALLFDGFQISLLDVGVTVDGQPAALVPAALADGTPEIAAFVEPAPVEGQTVVVSGSFCEGCEPVTITYTAGPDDVVAPSPVVEEAFVGIYDHKDFVSSGGDCQSDSDLTFYVHLSQIAPAAGETPSLFTVAWDPDGDGDAGFRATRRADGDSLTINLSVIAAQLGGKDPLTEICLEVTAIDTANNAAAPFQLCQPCFFRKDDIEHGFDTPAEPEWVDADGVPGSACASEVETTGEETTGETTGEETAGTDTTPTSSGATSESTGDSTSDGTGDSDSGGATGGDDGDKGCGCQSDGGSPSDVGRFLLFVLGLGLALIKRRS